MAGKFFTCRENLVNRLKADAFFSGLAVITKREGDIEAQIDEKVAQSDGIALVVIIRRIRRSDPGALDFTLVFALSAVELPTINSSGKSSEDVVEKSILLLDGKPNGVGAGDEALVGQFRVVTDAIVPLPPPPRNKALNIQVLTVETDVSLI